MGHKYTVEFRIYSKELDVHGFSREIGLTPCQVQTIGSDVGGRVRQQAMWAFNGSEDPGERRLEWDSLEEGLTYILDKLEPQRGVLDRLAKDSDKVWWCAHFQDAFDGGPLLSATILSRLGTFGARLFIDNFYGHAGSDSARSQKQ